MNSSFETYGKEIKRRVITSADVYVPLGFKLGDFSEHLRVNEDVNDYDIAETIRVVEDEVYSEEPPTRPSTAESLSDIVTKRVLSEKMNQEVKFSSNSGTIIEMVIPHDDRIRDESTVANGLSLLNLAMNSDIVAATSSRKFIGDAITKMVDGVGDESLMKDVFQSLGDETKCEIMAEYLRDETLVAKMRERTSFDLSTNNTSGGSIDEQIIQIVRLVGSIWGVLYGSLVVPLMAMVWHKVVTLNREFHLLETVLRLSIGWLVVLLGFLLRLVVALSGGKRDSQVTNPGQFDRVAHLVVNVVHRALERTQSN